MGRRSGFVAFLIAGTVLGVPGQAPAAEPIHPTLTAELVLDRPAGRVLEARLPWRANMLGVSLPGADEGEVGVEVRAHDGERWTPWASLDADGEHAPDGAEALRAARVRTTDPVWVGAARTVQVRVDAPRGTAVPRVIVHAMNTAGDARELSLPARAWRSVTRFLTMRPQQAEAMTSTPKVISRATWGGSTLTRKPSGFSGYAPDVKMVFLHHTDNPNGYTRSQSAAIVRGIHRFHTRTRDFSDIGYNFLVDRYGQVFEGRWGGPNSTVIGAHTMGFNTSSTGIALIGTYSSLTPPLAAQRALKLLIAWKMDIHHIPVIGTVLMRSAGNERYDEGEMVRFNRLAGHRNAKPTACPGNRAYDLLPSLRRGAAALGLPKIYLPTAWTTSGLGAVRPDGDGVDEGVRFRATFSHPLTWTLRISGPTERTFTGSGTSLNVPWSPRSDPALPPTGRYLWRLEGRTSGGAIARPAVGLLYIVTDHPVGTLLRDPSGSYVVGPEPTRRDATTVTRASNFGTYRAIPTGPVERDRYPIAVTLPMREGTLLQGPDGSRYIFSGGTLRRFVSEQVFAELGYSTSALVPADESTLLSQPAGAPVEDVTRHPDGTPIVDPSGQTWVIETGTLRPIEALALASRYREDEVVPAVDGDLALPHDLTTVDIREGAVLRDADNVSYVYTGGVLRRFRDNVLYARMGYSWAMRLQATAEEIGALTPGPIYG